MPVRESDVEALLWCMRPTLDLYRLRQPLPESVRKIPVVERSFRPAEHVRFGRFLVVTETTNQWRAVERLVSSATLPVAVPVPSAADREETFTALGVSNAIERMAVALDGRVDAPVRESLENQLYKVALALRNARALDLGSFAGVLVSTQHSPIIRALLVAAREQSAPVVYVPHAPVADNGAYWDLPVSYAGLRGRGEQDYYRDQLGISPNDVDIVGNLATDVLSRPMPPIDADAPGVLAVSPHAEEITRALFSTIGSRDLGPMIVAPHPRSDLDQLRAIMPSDWRLHEGGRTLDLLRGGAPFLFQFSSGVAWESAAFGIPTATIRLADDPVNYPFLANETIYPPIRSSEDAQRFAHAARAHLVDRRSLRHHAEQWCARDAEPAMRALFSLLDRVAAAPREDEPHIIHDGWVGGGAALGRSWIAGTAVAPHA